MPYRDPTAQREYQKRWMAKRRAAWFEGKTCSDCGFSDGLEIHHIDPGKKVSHALWSWSKDKRDAELSKCEVLCRDCHEDRHWPHSMPRSPILANAIRERETKALQAYLDKRRLRRAAAGK